MKNETTKNMTTAKTVCASCATYHGVRKAKPCTYRADFVVAGAKGAMVCSGCYSVAMDARHMAAEGKTYAFGETA